MHKSLWITVFIIFVVFFGLFTLSQVPVTIPPDEVLAAIDDAVAEMNLKQVEDSRNGVDMTEVEQLVNAATAKLEARQVKRLKYLISAYFVIWLVFILYALRLAQTQDQLRKRLEQLQAGLQQKERK
ncbi:CcmD family protein [Candidatus Poribacteria bacterium]|nr:CcmD family protein [Candidatus Poribacteria bacterium]